jgi:hypothetical protein
MHPSRQSLCNDEHDPAGDEADGDATEDVEGEVGADVHTVEADRDSGDDTADLPSSIQPRPGPTMTATATAVWLDGYPAPRGSVG